MVSSGTAGKDALVRETAAPLLAKSEAEVVAVLNVNLVEVAQADVLRQHPPGR